jgi:hypothetical protein
MRRALRTGLFIGTLLGMSACAGAHDAGRASTSGVYGAIEVGRTG